jgi:glycerate-2-kinase
MEARMRSSGDDVAVVASGDTVKDYAETVANRHVAH